MIIIIVIIIIIAITIIITSSHLQCRGKGGMKHRFPTLKFDSCRGQRRRCEACDVSGGRVALWRCDAAVGPVTLRRCWRCDAATLEWRCDAVGAATLRRSRWRCDAATRERRCDAVGAATLRRGSDAATLLALRRFLLQECTRRCVAARHGNPHWRSSMNVEVYI